jgi:predicted esterase
MSERPGREERECTCASDPSPVTHHSSPSYVVFSHGLEGDPRGPKILALSAVAQRRGWRVESVDYRGMDPMSRIDKLLEVCRSLPQPLVLVGSSLGGHVAATVSAQVRTQAMFLLAPAFFMPGYEQYTPRPAECHIEIVHGWNDDVVPPANSIRFAQLHRSTLHLIDSDHRLTASIDEICSLFDLFLQRLALP